MGILINEDFLVVLKRNVNNLITKDLEFIPKTLIKEIEEFIIFFDDQNQTLKNLISYVEKNNTIPEIYSPHNYCDELTGVNQSKLFFKQHIIQKINKKIDELKIDFNKLQSESKVVKEIFENLKNEYLICYKSYSINLAYKKCKEINSQIIVYSHRICGWSNPIYNLNENFSVEIKTNFGYGSKSYFYVLIKYKDIYLSPFSDWVFYENNRFGEIIRFTKLFHRQKLNSIYHKTIKNEFWEDAMNFVKDACNKSITDEEKFIQEYIIDECEKMVNGLEKIFYNNKVIFKNNIDDKYYPIDKKGHSLMDFRGEKISGALEFVNKILEFKNITKIDSFINKLEELNKKIQPELKQEIKLINFELEVLINEKHKKETILNKLTLEDNKYNEKKLLLRNKLIEYNKEKMLVFDLLLFTNILHNEYPEYSKFAENFQNEKTSYKIICEKISNLSIIKSNIERYIKNIQTYFNKRQTL